MLEERSKNMIFTGDRIILREWNESDFELFQHIFTNEQVMRYAYLDCFESIEELKDYFMEVLNNNNISQERKAYEYAVFLKSDDSFIGFADIEIYKKNEYGGHGEIGYFLLPTYWGKGYATEIAKLLIKIGFSEIGLHRLCASCNIENINSEHIMKKIGMKKEGHLRQVRFKNGTWQDELRYSILKEEG